MVQQDPFDLERFVTAQATMFERVQTELKSGRKRSHWMWFIFPQLRGLGFSATARLYGIASLDEAHAYLIHPVLGPRLETSTRMVLALQDRSLHDIFGSPDDMKFCSCMTLFSRAATGEPAVLFREAIERYCDGREDDRTIELLDADAAGAVVEDRGAD